MPRTPANWTAAGSALIALHVWQVHEEIDRVLGERRATMKDKLQMPYTEATITEVQRLANIVPLNFGHATKHEVTVGGYTLPRGARLLAEHLHSGVPVSEMAISCRVVVERHFYKTHQVLLFSGLMNAFQLQSCSSYKSVRVVSDK